MSKRLLSLLVAVLAMGLVAAGCGNDDTSTTSSSSGSSGTSTMEDHNMDDSSKAAGSGEGVESGSAELRAGLTALLEEHVYLAGIAVTQGVGEGLDSGAFKASAATLDANSKGLADAIGSVYGDDAGKQFLALWRDHIGFFVDYTAAKATKDAKGVKAAEQKLDGYRAEFGAFIESANENLPADAVADELKPHVESLFAAIDAVVAGDADAFMKLREAAGHMPGTAETLAHGIATQNPDMFPSS
jgi:cytochrome c556